MSFTLSFKPIVSLHKDTGSTGSPSMDLVLVYFALYTEYICLVLSSRVIIKVGDGVHHWKDLSVELGQKECSNSLNEMSNSFKQLQRVAQTSGISLVEAASAIRNLASMGASMSDFAQEKDASYRTLQYKYEVE